jgi:hypothetical protein
MTDPTQHRLDDIDKYAAEVEAEARSMDYEALISHYVTNAVNWKHCLDKIDELEAALKAKEQT